MAKFDDINVLNLAFFVYKDEIMDIENLLKANRKIMWPGKTLLENRYDIKVDNEPIEVMEKLHLKGMPLKKEEIVHIKGESSNIR